MGFISMAGRIEAHSSSAAQLYKIAKQQLGTITTLKQLLQETIEHSDALNLENAKLTRRVQRLEYLDRLDDYRVQAHRDEMLDAGVL